MRFFLTLLSATILWHTTAAPSYGQSGLTFIRDAELEHTLDMMSEPILKQAGLVPEHVNIYIIGSDDINAFVAGGQNIFVFTGLIKAMPEPDMLLAVLAHEVGHIEGGHLARGTEQLKNARFGSVVGFVLGIAAAAAGAPEAGSAVLSGSSHVLNRSLLAFTRSNEQAADQAAIGYLDALGISTSGMVKTFEVLSRKQRNLLGDVDPYAITHPLSTQRMQFARHHLEQSTIPEGQFPEAYREPYARMVAKLSAFTQSPIKTFQQYPQSDDSSAAQMARAVAWHKQAQTDLALTAMHQLLKRHPSDAFLYDLHGQILFESSRIDEAKDAYQHAHRLRPDEPLIQASLAEVYMAMNQPEYTTKALRLLEKATTIEPNYTRGFRLLATAYGRNKDFGLSYMALAEEAALRGDADAIESNLARAKRVLPAQSPSRLRADDLQEVARDIRQRQ